MKFVKAVFSVNELSKSSDIANACLQRAYSLYQQHITEVRRCDFNGDRFGNGRYIACKQPPIYDEDWAIEKEATEYVLIGSSDNFYALEAICEEVTKNLNRILNLLRKCEWPEKEYPDDIKAIRALHTEMLSKVNYANRYVVE